MSFADCLRSKLGRSGDEQCLSAKTLQPEDLRVHRRVGYLIGRRKDALAEFVFERLLEALHKILSHVVVLEKDSNLHAGQGSLDIAGVDFAFGIVARQSDRKSV